MTVEWLRLTVGIFRVNVRSGSHECVSSFGLIVVSNSVSSTKTYGFRNMIRRRYIHGSSFRCTQFLGLLPSPDVPYFKNKK